MQPLCAALHHIIHQKTGKYKIHQWQAANAVTCKDYLNIPLLLKCTGKVQFENKSSNRFKNSENIKQHHVFENCYVLLYKT